MKSAERYQKLVSELIVELAQAETLSDELKTKCNTLDGALRSSRWTGRFDARWTLWELTTRLKNKHKNRLKLLQGGNEFLARRSRAVLTLINCEQINETQTKRGA